MPKDLPALVKSMTADELTLALINVNQVVPSMIIVQAGTRDNRRHPAGHGRFLDQQRLPWYQRTFGD